MKKWNILNKFKIKNSKFKIVDLIDLLLENRGLKTKKEKDDFLNPKLEVVTSESVGIDLKQLEKALERIKKAIEKKEQIIVFGDYDVDGITGSAILWETLHSLGASVMPYIPHRMEEGYGLSTTGISNVQLQISNVKLIITVDNGIVANGAVDFANKNNIDVIITDHHVIDKKVPNAYAIVHTTKLCGAGVAYLLSKEIKYAIASEAKQSHAKKIAASSFHKLRTPRNDESVEDTHLELAALGTIADMVPLTGANRAIVKYGLEKLPKTKRLGLMKLYKQAGLPVSKAGLSKNSFTPYNVGFIIAPRLNASGRIESAMDSLRLLCTTNIARAEKLAAKLELINKERQQLLQEAKEHAVMQVKNQKSKIKSLLFVSDESYAPGVIGLVASKLVEEFYRPAIVVSTSERHSKASVRSISGFNIIEFLRLHTKHFVNVGGHPMAAGFTVETEKIEILKKTLEKKAEEMLNEELLIRSLKLDCELDFSCITQELYDDIQQLAPFGMGNPEPTFTSKNVTIEDIRIIGRDGSHLKLIFSQESKIKNQVKKCFEAIGFGMGKLISQLKTGSKIDIAYTIDKNFWNGNSKLQLKIKDILIANPNYI